MTTFLPTPDSGLILCCYSNPTAHVQVIRIANIPDRYLEKVAFPGERLLFEAPFNAQLEIHTGTFVSAILSDTIPCHALEVKQVDPIASLA